MNKLLASTIATLMPLCSVSATSEDIGSGSIDPLFWGNIYGDYVNYGGWFTNNHYHSDDAIVVGFEGGIVGETFDVYGFTEGNLTKKDTFTKLTGHKKLFGDVTLYSQASQFGSKNYTDANVVLGFGYKGIQGNKFSLTPWIGANHNVNSKEDAVMMGWSGNYNITENIYMTHWNEITVKNAGTDYRGDFGLYHALPNETFVGIQYRYVDTNSGKDKFDDNLAIRFGIHL